MHSESVDLISEEKPDRVQIKQLDNHVWRIGPLGSPRVLSSYLIADEKIAIIDCGPSSVISELSSLVAQCSIGPKEIDYLLLTHIHLDHAGGAARFLQQYPNARVMIPERGYRHMLEPSALNASSLPIIGEEIFRRWGACEPVPAERAERVSPYSKIGLGETEVEYIPATGHAPHHNVLKMSQSSIVFSADSMGIVDKQTNSIVPTCPPPSFDFPQALKDISMVEAFSPRLSCIAHFEEVQPTKSLFERVTGSYQKWSERALELIMKKKLKAYDLNDCRELFSRMVEDFPQYGSLSSDLKEQAIRIDCAGILNYHLRASAL